MAVACPFLPLWPLEYALSVSHQCLKRVQSYSFTPSVFTEDMIAITLSRFLMNCPLNCPVRNSSNPKSLQVRLMVASITLIINLLCDLSSMPSSFHKRKTRRQSQH